MISRDRSDEIQEYLKDDGWQTGRDETGALVALKGCTKRVYNKDGRGGYFESAGPTGVYVDEFGNT